MRQLHDSRVKTTTDQSRTNETAEPPKRETCTRAWLTAKHALGHGSRARRRARTDDATTTHEAIDGVAGEPATGELSGGRLAAQAELAGPSGGPPSLTPRGG